MTTSFCLGIDVSKHQLDLSTAQRFLGTYDNNRSGIKRMIAVIHKHNPDLVLIESTGIYSRLVADLVAEQDLCVSVVQPGRIRQFARSQGILAKTDKIDAAVIARFGEGSHDLRPYKPASEEMRHFRALIDRRDQLREDEIREKNRLEACRDSWVIKNLKKSICSIQKHIKDIEESIESIAESTNEIREAREVMTKAFGVAKITAYVFIAYLPELGRVNRQEIAGLAGVAPYNVDSGTYKGKRRIYGGRERIKTALHMATMTCRKKGSPFYEFYTRLISNGKKRRVAGTAIQRKLIIYVNSLMKEYYDSKAQAA